MFHPSPIAPPKARAGLGRNYWIYTVGSATSLIGNWLQKTTIGWVTWNLTHSPLWLGLVAFAELFPTVALAPFAGAVVDRNDQLKALKWSQIVAMAQAVALALILAWGKADVVLIVALTLVLGVSNAFYLPARLSLLSRLVDARAMTTAVSINSVVGNSAILFGPAVAGVILQYSTPQVGLAVNAATFVILLAAISLLRLSEFRPAAHSGGLLDGARAGCTYIARHRIIGPLMVVFFLVSLLARSIIEQLPGVSAGIFHGGPATLSLFTCSLGLGAIAAGFIVARVDATEQSTLNFMIWSMLLSGVLILALMAMTAIWIGAILLFAIGMTFAFNGIVTQTVLQTTSDVAFRGRVVGLYGAVFRAAPATGAVLIGLMAAAMGLRAAIAVVALALCAAWAPVRLYVLPRVCKAMRSARSLPQPTA
jgi:MFS family permease